MHLGNSIDVLGRMRRRRNGRQAPKAKLLLTSPPYFGVTNYHYDQWLRLWLLGFETDPYVARGSCRGRFVHAGQYKGLLEKVFCSAAEIVADDATIYVRTSKNKFTKEATLDALSKAFKNKQLKEKRRRTLKPTQTRLFGDSAPKPGEVDNPDAVLREGLISKCGRCCVFRSDSLVFF